MRRVEWIVVLLSLLVVSCATFDPYRSDSAGVCDLVDRAAENASAECKQASVERLRGFDIGYVEFSDQGWLHSRAQLTRALSLLREPDPRDLQVIVFVHGWKHSARFDDEDVSAFRATVMPTFVRRHPQARTVGIYVGWRGAALSLPSAIQNISFYDRKSTADHVARGSVRELFSHLRAIRYNHGGNAGRRVSVVLIGHSFGGLILYNAIAESLLDSLVAANNGNPAAARQAQPVVDLAILLNPAFEASRFEPLFQAAKDRLARSGSSWAYAAQQRPLLVSITSEADSATRTAFTFGRAVNSIFQHEGWTDQDDRASADYGQRLEKLANTHTPGHMERYRTHRIALAARGESAGDIDAARQPIACTVLPNSILAEENRFPLWNMFAAADAIDSHHDIYRASLWEFIATMSDPLTNLNQVCR